MNENTRTGIRRAVNAAWDKLPEALTATVMALVIFGFGLWLDMRDVKSVMDGIKFEQTTPRLCERIQRCDCTDCASRGIEECQRKLIEGLSAIHGHEREAGEWRKRIERLELQFYDLSTSPKARADPFTGTEGRELDRRIRNLEDKLK